MNQAPILPRQSIMPGNAEVPKRANPLAVVRPACVYRHARQAYVFMPPLGFWRITRPGRKQLEDTAAHPMAITVEGYLRRSIRASRL
jgi:hypothetical protein